MKKPKTSAYIISGTTLRRIFLFFLILITGIISPAFGQVKLSKAIQQEPILRRSIPESLMQIQLVPVPQLVGRNFNPDEISAMLNKARLQLGNAVPVENNEKIGIIISQSPELRQRVRRGTPVDITYGINVQVATPELPENVIVPDYIGMNLDQVLGRLPNDRLTQGLTTEISSDQPPGVVVEQFPPSGSNVDMNSSVTLKLSSGPQQISTVDVPRLIGLTLEEAAQVLISNQLFAGILKEEISEKREGEVLDQSPSENTAVAIGSAINLTYSIHEEVIVPVYDTLPKSIPSWMYWAGGIIAALLLGGFLGWKSGKGKRERSARKEPELELKIIPDAGKQTFHLIQSGPSLEGLYLKIIPDKGIQTIKMN